MATIATITMPPTTRRVGLILVVRGVATGGTDESGGAIGGGPAGFSGAGGNGVSADTSGGAATDPNDVIACAGSARIIEPDGTGDGARLATCGGLANSAVEVVA
jgi:hypothetical protein